MELGQTQTFSPQQNLVGVTCHSALLFSRRAAICVFYDYFLLIVYIRPVL